MSAPAVRVGVAGAGKWGMNVVRACARLGVLAAVCDPDLHPLEDVRTRYEGVRVFCDFEAMLQAGHLDAVAIASPARLHAQLALAAIESGHDVFVEKPLATNVADAQLVVDAAAARGVKVVVGHVLLYHPAVCRMIELVREGRIGEVRHVRSRRAGWGRLRSFEDVWWSFAPHDVSVMLAVTGDEPFAAAASMTAYVRPDVADIAYADFRFAGGRTGHIEVTWTDPDKGCRTDVFGSRGTLTFVEAPGRSSLSLTPCGDRLGASGEPELWREPMQHLDIAPGEPLALEMQAFCAAVRGGPLPPSHGGEGLAVVRVLAMACEHGIARNGAIAHA